MIVLGSTPETEACWFDANWRKNSKPVAKGGEIVVDLFCGGGGASVGIEAAMGSAVDVAINHSSDAIHYHERNHPATTHYKTDVFDVHPMGVTRGRPVGLLWLSPDCTHFSKAKGKAPKDKNIRSLATVGLWWAAQVRPRVICLENVEEFLTWGPLHKKTRQPDPRRKGKTFASFVRRLRQHGYAVEWRVLKACDYGAPTIRKRLFLVARCDGNPIEWPEPTHGEGRNNSYRTAAECIDFTIPTVSIFASKDEVRAAGLKAVRPLADKTMERIARGIWKFVIDNPKPFVIGIDNKSSKGAEWGVEMPLPTITSKNRFALVSPFLAKHYTGVVGSRVDAPLGTVTAVDHHSLVCCHIEQQNGMSRGVGIDTPLTAITSEVNKHCLVATHIERMQGTARGESIAKPLSGISAQGGHHALVTSHLLSYHSQQGDESRCYPHTEPLPTVDGSNRFAEVRAFLIKYYGQGIGQRVDEPLGTVVGKDKFGLVTVHGQDYRIIDIGLRMLAPDELLKAQFGRFASDYRIDGLTKSKAVKMIGNSVCPDLSYALVKANFKRRSRRVLKEVSA